MKNRFKLILLLALTSIMSCSSGSEDEASAKLSMDIGNASALLIPAPTYSCEERAKGTLSGTGSVGKSYFELPIPTITWSGTAGVDDLSEVRLVLLQFKIEAPQVGKYECTLSGATLGILFWDTSTDANGVVTVSTWDQKLGLYSGLAVNSTKDIPAKGYTGCNIICGGLSIPEGTGRFTVKGRWELFGVQKRYTDATKSSYEEFPLKVNGDFSVQNPLD
jgi:hypothetical protein